MKDSHKILHGSIIILFSLFAVLFIIYAQESDAESRKSIHFFSVNKEDSSEKEDDTNTLTSNGIVGMGKGRIVLQRKKHDDANIPILAQNDFPEPNTIYVIKYDFLLAEDIELPANCILDFEGGSLRGGYNHRQQHFNKCS